MNEDVDAVARNASAQIQIDGHSNEIATSALAPYQYIAYSQMKKEVRKRSEIFQTKRWNQYRYSRKDDECGSHLKRWNIRAGKKWYQEELKYLNQRANQMRILLYTGKIPTASFIHFNLNQHHMDEHCEHCDFGSVRKEDTIKHRLLDCLGRREAIEVLVDQIKKWYKLSKVEFNDNRNNPDYIKQFIFPQINNAYIRMKILTLVIDYLLYDDPDIVKNAERYWVPHKRCLNSNSCFPT